MVVISVYTYGVKIIKKFRWESGFLWGGFHGTPPLCTNGSAGYLMQLSVNISKITICPILPSVMGQQYNNKQQGPCDTRLSID